MHGTHRFNLFEVIGDVVIRLDERPAVIEDRADDHSEAVHVAVDAADLFLLHLRRCREIGMRFYWTLIVTHLYCCSRGFSFFFLLFLIRSGDGFLFFFFYGELL